MVNNWTGVVDGNGNNVLNWSLLALSSTDTLTFTNASAVNCTCSAGWTVQDINVTNYAGTINLGTYSHSLTGNLTLAATCTLTPGTSLINFTGTGASVITSAGKTLYDVTVNNASKAFSFADNASLHTLTTSAMASYSHASTNLTSSGNVTFNGAGTLNLGNGITMNGASGALTVGSTVVAGTTLNCILTFNGTTGMSAVFNKTFYYLGCVLGVSAKVTVSGSAAYFELYTAGQNNLTLLTFGANSTFTDNLGVFLSNASATGTTLISQGSGAVYNGSGNLQCDNSNAAVKISDSNGLDYTGSGSVTRTFYGTFNLGGNTNFHGNTVTFTNFGLGYPITFNTNGYAFTCGFFQFGNSAGSSFMTLNFGSSVINCSYFYGAGYNTGTTNVNFQTSQWTCSGNWANGSNHTVTHQTDQVTFTNTATITSAGKSFYNVKILSGAATVTLADNMVCNLLTIATGTLNRNGKSVTAAYDDIMITDDCLDMVLS